MTTETTAPSRADRSRESTGGAAPPRRRPSRHRRHLANAALAIGGLVLGLVLVELGLRAYAQLDSGLGYRLRTWDPYRVLVEPHGVRGYRQRPNSTYRYVNGTAATSNASGYRGPRVPITKPEGTFRILLLGGSATHGFGVEDGETIDAFMRDLLERRYPARDFDVVNLAFDGYDSYQLLARLRSDGLRLDPDLVIVNSGINDVRNARFRDIQEADPRTVLWRHVLQRLREEQERGGPSLWSRIKHYSYLSRLPGVLRHLEVRDDHQPLPDRTGIYPDALDHFEQNLRRIAQEAAARNIPVVFSVAPSHLERREWPDDGVRRGYWLATPELTREYRDRLGRRMRQMVREFRAEGLRVSFLEHDLDPRLFLDDAHLTAMGNRTLAAHFTDAASEYISEYIEDSR